MKEKSKKIKKSISGKNKCPMCGKKNITTKWEKEVTGYGEEEKYIELSLKIPVRTCNDCSFQFTDCEAEELQHEAICRSLGRLTPNEIRNLRDKYDLTRKKFARLTGIGEASLARWETGELIQSEAYDNFLYLLNYSKNLNYLLMRNSHEELPNTPENIETHQTPVGRFAALEALSPDEIFERKIVADSFQLN